MNQKGKNKTKPRYGKLHITHQNNKLILRDMRRIYTASTPNQLTAYLKEKGLI
ncbi:MAG: hypothetical protein WC248_08265 [Candidatus Methanomethylophilaceae archaeon]|jgi:hypothetical protein